MLRVGLRVAADVRVQGSGKPCNRHIMVFDLDPPF